MNATVKLRNAAASEHYDVAIVICGYESRSTKFLEVCPPAADVRVAFAYGSHKVLAYESNFRTLKSNSFEVIEVDSASYVDFLRGLMERAISVRPGHRLRIFVDLSCMTRLRLAQLVSLLCEIDCFVDFFYSLADFSPPNSNQPPNEFLEPASAFFAGWSGDIEKPTAVVAGLGYEYMRAIGVIDHLDASDVWLFSPRSLIDSYDSEVDAANNLLLRDTDESRVLHYRVDDFGSLCRELFSLVGSLRYTHRVVVLPLGPKIFALAAFLAGLTYRDVAVWRASAGEYGSPVERSPSEHFFLVGVEISASVMSARQ